ILLLVLLFVTFTPTAFAKDVFGNTKWAMKVEPDEDARRLGARPYDDTYTFKGSKLESEALKKKGFEQTDYEENQRIGGIATFTAGLQTLIGGNITLWTTMCENARKDSYDLMVRHAQEQGANAIVAVRYDANEVASGVTEVLAYGTAVVVEASQ